MCPEARKGKAMIRIGLAIVALLSALAAPSFAQDRPDNADGRFTLHRTDEGFLRLDGEIARLQADNANLKRELLAHNLPLPGGGRPDVSGREELQLPSDAELNRMMTFMEKVWKRMVEMIVTTQKDIMKKP